MVAGADRKTEAVEQSTQIHRMNLPHIERNDRSLPGHRAVELHLIDLGHARHGVTREHLFVRSNPIQPHRLHIVDGGGQTVRTHIVGRARFELKRQAFEGGVLKSDAGDHLSAPLIGRELLQQCFFAVKHAHAGGTVDFVCAEREKIAIQLLHIDRKMRHTLRAVHQEVGTGVVRHPRHLAYGIHRAEYVAHLAAAHQAGALIEQRGVGFEVQTPLVVHRHDAQREAPPLACQLPGHNVGVVLHDGDNHLIALAQEGLRKRRCDEIEALGRPSRENNLGRGTRIEERAYPFARRFVQRGGFLRKRVDAAMHIGVAGGVERVHGLQHGAGLLCRGGIVEIHQRAAVHLTAQYGKIFAIVGHHERFPVQNFTAHSSQPSAQWRCSPRKRRSTRSESRSRSASLGTRCSTSATKACCKSRRASARGIPRWRR